MVWLWLYHRHRDNQHREQLEQSKKIMEPYAYIQAMIDKERCIICGSSHKDSNLNHNKDTILSVHRECALSIGNSVELKEVGTATDRDINNIQINKQLEDVMRPLLQNNEKMKGEILLGLVNDSQKDQIKQLQNKIE